MILFFVEDYQNQLKLDKFISIFLTVAIPFLYFVAIQCGNNHFEVFFNGIVNCDRDKERWIIMYKISLEMVRKGTHWAPLGYLASNFHVRISGLCDPLTDRFSTDHTARDDVRQQCQNAHDPVNG